MENKKRRHRGRRYGGGFAAKLLPASENSAGLVEVIERRLVLSVQDRRRELLLDDFVELVALDDRALDEACLHHSSHLIHPCICDTLFGCGGNKGEPTDACDQQRKRKDGISATFCSGSGCYFHLNLQVIYRTREELNQKDPWC